MDYTVIVHEAEEGGYWVEVPALPGCYSQGESVEEALANVREAVSLHVEALREDGQEVPLERGLNIGRVSL
ncbi:MAG TPA: type II toxin-antitoxin system HicB family antitoxin [Candidatus Binatia bacterium]|jgi:predicted RNase H-like HicB family nuclease|nr:type II toxin-antitoxin system HicB family antitoxin [Candidatus Binatia bacterium]